MHRKIFHIHLKFCCRKRGKPPQQRLVQSRSNATTASVHSVIESKSPKTKRNHNRITAASLEDVAASQRLFAESAADENRRRSHDDIFLGSAQDDKIPYVSDTGMPSVQESYFLASQEFGAGTKATPISVGSKANGDRISPRSFGSATKVNRSRNSSGQLLDRI